MDKIGRRRKRSHRFYGRSKKIQVNKENTAVPSGKISSFQSSVPLKYQFSLRDVPSAVLNQPSITNFTTVFSVLNKDNILKSKWNLIEHSDLFMMLCTFAPGVTPPVPEKSIMINLDFTYKVFACNILVTNLENIPNEVSHTEHFVKLLDYVDQQPVCPGIVCIEKLKQLAMSGGRNGIFKDKRGNIRGNLNESSTCIRPVDCFGIVQNSNNICESCRVFRKSLLTMLSNQNAKKQSQSATSANSHCPWKYLSTEEAELRAKNLREEKHKMAREISHLKQKFQKVFYQYIFVGLKVVLLFPEATLTVKING